MEDLEIATRFFASVRNQGLSETMVERILSYWDKCIKWSSTAVKPPEELLSNLSLLSCYLGSIKKRELEWLLAVSTHVQVGHNFEYFIEQLDRLADANPDEVCTVLGKVIETYDPDFDFQDKLKLLLTKLAKCGRREYIISFTERLRHLPGIRQLYNDLTQRG